MWTKINSTDCHSTFRKNIERLRMFVIFRIKIFLTTKTLLVGHRIKQKLSLFFPRLSG